jgi:hypothetical protein
MFGQATGRRANGAHNGPQWKIRLVDLWQLMESKGPGALWS